MKALFFLLKMAGLAGCGIVLAVIGALFGGAVLGRHAAGFGALGLAIYGMFIGFTAGTVIGLWLMKRLFHQRGSIWLGMAGAVIGTLAIVGLAEPLKLNSNSNLLFGVFLVLVTALALGGFYLRKSLSGN